MKNLSHPFRISTLLLALCGLPLAAGAGLADISNVPLGTSSTNVKPNIMFIMDDSGSMNSEYMPDDMGSWDRFGYYSSQCNGLWFNPNNNYDPPVSVASNGSITLYPNASFIAAWVDGYNTGAGTTNLNNWGYYQYSGTQPVMGWTYNADGTRANSTFVTECRTSYNGAGPFNWVNITTASDATLKQKYANWYSYYRTRLNLMRTAAGRAFQELDTNYRVGFTMISDDSVSGGDFLDIADFNNTQKYDFFNKLYTSYSGSWTPLRAALAKVGQYYGNVANGQTKDPFNVAGDLEPERKYSCQRNYAILSTDGYWNSNIENGSYKPYKLDRATLVGQQDGDEVRPMKDGASTVTTERTTDPFETITTTVTPVTSTYSGNLYQAAATTGTSGCGGSQYRVQRNRASCAVTWDQTSVATRTENAISTVVTTNGVRGTPTSSTSVSTNTTNSPSSGPACPDGNWVTGSSRSSQCWSSSDLSAISLSPGGAKYVANGSAPSETTGTATVTGTTTNDPPAITTTETTTTGGSSNSLADVAEYYYRTDIRPDLANTLKPAGPDTAAHQHMTTYTVGLGVKGTLSYETDYLTTPANSDYAALIAGTKDWPVPSALNGGSENATHVDDLWHAAVNGRGRYFSALDPQELTNSLTTTLGEIAARRGSAAAAAASSLRPTDADGWVFVPTYMTHSNTSSWHGDIRAYRRPIVSGVALAPDTTDGRELWSARNILEDRTSARRILFSNGTGLTNFTYSNLSTASLNTSFDNRCSTASTLLSQCSSLSANAKAKVTGANLVSYITGDKSLYLNAASTDDRVFRTRTYRLGDIVNSSPVYVGKPPFRYVDAGYSSFVTANASRPAVLYVGGNDGMLHAFKVGLSVDADKNPVVATDAGSELWAFIPSAVIPELWRLADEGFDSNHRSYVDAPPTVSDVYDSNTNQWRTILVGGLGAGGRSYYALDITDPVNPALLWEFTDSNLGLSYGNPVITKNAAGTWVVMFSSGVNNNAGNGKGRLYIRNAITGAAENGGFIETSAGSTTTPSNLMRIDAWVDSDTNNTATRVYGGDMLGNLWRFDFDNKIDPSGNEATLLGIAQTSGSTRQPITIKPLLNEISVSGTRYPVISFGTGRYLGTSDLTDSTTQTIYSVKDALASSGLGVLRDTGAALVAQTMNSSHRVTTPVSIDWISKNGWYIDLNVSSKERIVIDGQTLTSTLIQFASAIPGDDTCQPGGTAYLYTFDLLTGKIVRATYSQSLLVSLTKSFNLDRTTDALVCDMTGTCFKDKCDPLTDSECKGPETGPGSARRSSWRELID